MEHRTRLAEEIQLTEAQALYDASCKRLLSNKIFLAWILKNCLEEYKDCDVETIRDQYIEGVPAVGEVAVHPDQTNAQLGAGQSIMGLNTEDKRLTEGQINYDIRFFALAPQDGSQVRIIVNVEAQNKYNPGYPLVKRGLYYASRMISAQYSEEFEKSEYGKLKKVCSIWICLNAEKERRNSITRYALREERVVGQGGEKKEHYDLITVVMICLGKAEEAGEASLLRMLDVLLSSERKAQEKIGILSEEFSIAMSEPLEEEVEQMCNLSQGIVEQGMAKGMAQGIAQGRAEGRSEGRAEGRAEGRTEGIFAAKLSSIQSVVSELHLTVEQAMNVLRIPPEERASYRAALEAQGV